MAATHTSSTDHDEPSSLPLELLCDLFAHQFGNSPLSLADLSPLILAHLHTHASHHRDRAVEEARVLLDVALESLEAGLSLENQRRLLECAHDRLVLAERQGVMAENAACLREEPGLLAGARPRRGTRRGKET